MCHLFSHPPGKTTVDERHVAVETKSYINLTDCWWTKSMKISVGANCRPQWTFGLWEINNRVQKEIRNPEHLLYAYQALAAVLPPKPRKIKDILKPSRFPLIALHFDLVEAKRLCWTFSTRSGGCSKCLESEDRPWNVREQSTTSVAVVLEVHNWWTWPLFFARVQSCLLELSTSVCWCFLTPFICWFVCIVNHLSRDSTAQQWYI